MCFMDFEKFSPDTLGVNIRVNFENFFIYAWIVMKFALNDKAKEVLMILQEIKFLKFIFSRNWILMCLWTWKKFSPDRHKSEL